MTELFAGHGVPESLCTDSGSQFANVLFADFATDWKFHHNTSAPRYPRRNGKAEAAVKIVKGLLTHAKYSSHDPYLALLVYYRTPMLPCIASVPIGITHHSATAYTEHKPKCCS